MVRGSPWGVNESNHSLGGPHRAALSTGPGYGGNAGDAGEASRAASGGTERRAGRHRTYERQREEWEKGGRTARYDDPSCTPMTTSASASESANANSSPSCAGNDRGLLRSSATALAQERGASGAFPFSARSLRSGSRGRLRPLKSLRRRMRRSAPPIEPREGPGPVNRSARRRTQTNVPGVPGVPGTSKTPGTPGATATTEPPIDCRTEPATPNRGAGAHRIAAARNNRHRVPG